MREEADKSLTLNNKYLAQHGDQLDKYTKAKIEAKNRYLEAVKDEKNSEADRLEFAKRMNREIAAADKERSDDAAKAQAEAAKKAADKQKEIDDKRKADLKSQQDALRSIINKTQQDIENDADKTEAQKLDRQRQRDIKELDAIKLSAKDKREALDLINKKYDILNTELEIKTKEEKDKKDKEDAEKKAAALKEQGDRLIAAELLRIKTIQDAEKAAAEEQKRIDEEAAKNKEIVLSTVSNLGNRFADIVGRQTIAGKALAIASATIDTYQAANSALKANYGPFGPAAAIARFVSVAATIAAGIKNVKTIASTQVPGGGGGGSSVPTPSIPTAPVLPQASSTTINQGQINQIGNVAARAFVVESDVSGNQERIQRLNRAARIS
jgi:hypothetical protein